MPTTTDVSDLTKPVFDTVRTGQELWVETVRIWTELGQRTWPWLLPRDDRERHPLSPTAMIDLSFDHARQLLDVQEACLKALLGNGGEPRPSERKSQPASAPPSRTTAEKTAA